MPIEYRPGAGSGLWLCFLLPAALSASDTHGDAGKAIAVSAIAMALQSTTNVSSLVWAGAASAVCLTAGLGWPSIFACPALIVAHARQLPRLFSAFPKSFTYGEGCLATQALALYQLAFLVNWSSDARDVTTVDGSFAVIADSGLQSLILLCAASSAFPSLTTTPIFYVAGTVVFSGLTLPYLWLKLRRNPVTWLISHVLSSRESVAVVAYWAVCAAMSIVVAVASKDRATTVSRKIFHASVVAVFVPGLAVDPGLLKLATVCVFAVMLLLEFMRLRDIEPLSSLIRPTFGKFIDDKDAGSLVLTHIYLLVGASLPLWLSTDVYTADRLAMLSGVLSIGVGDSFASIVGSRYGRVKISNTTNKTVEGCAASVVSQILFVLILELAGYVPVGSTVSWRVLGSVSAVSLVEALTTQVDNLAIPLVMFVLLSVST